MAEIDELNILQASLSRQRAVEGPGVAPTMVLIDGNQCPSLTCDARSWRRPDGVGHLGGIDHRQNGSRCAAGTRRKTSATASRSTGPLDAGAPRGARATGPLRAQKKFHAGRAGIVRFNERWASKEFRNTPGANRMIHCVLHDPNDSVAVVVVEGVKAGMALTGLILTKTDHHAAVRAGHPAGSQGGTEGHGGRRYGQARCRHRKCRSDRRASTRMSTTSRPSVGEDARLAPSNFAPDTRDAPVKRRRNSLIPEYIPMQKTIWGYRRENGRVGVRVITHHPAGRRSVECGLRSRRS
jgi:hypothetical protein